MSRVPSITAQRPLSVAQARRIAVTAQGLGEPPSGAPVSMAALMRTVRRLGVLQIDSVNVLARAHLLPLFARLGPYPVELLTRAAWPARSRDRLLTETWAHEASLVPVELHPLLRWERRHWSTAGAARMAAAHPGLLDDITAIVRGSGPCSAGAIEKRLATAAKGRPGWWEWSEAKRGCEALFAAGVLGTATRRGFERQYDLIERVLPARIRVLPVPEPAVAKRHLVDIAARAHGIATIGDLADYFRMPRRDAGVAVTELVDAGILTPARVAGWTEPAYLHTAARIPRAVSGAALLGPFDPLVWTRARAERLFGFHYRIEIYTPADRRVHGYYVFPFLLGSELVGRFDLKADRHSGRLLVQASWSEPGHDPARTAAAAAEQLWAMADWLGLDEVAVMPRGDLAGAMSAVADRRPDR